MCWCSYRTSVDADGALEASLGDPPGERVEERRLAGAARAEDRRDLPPERLARDVVEQVHFLLDLDSILLLLFDDAVRQLLELQPLPGKVHHLLPRDRHRPRRDVATSTAAAAVLLLVVVLVLPPSRIIWGVEEALQALHPLRPPRRHLGRRRRRPPSVTRSLHRVVGIRLGPLHAVVGSWPLGPFSAVMTTSRHVGCRRSVAAVGRLPAGSPATRHLVLLLLLLLAMHACAWLALRLLRCFVCGVFIGATHSLHRRFRWEQGGF